MAFDSKSGKNSKQHTENKPKKRCYWSWLEKAEIKTFEVWNKDRKS